MNAAVLPEMDRLGRVASFTGGVLHGADNGFGGVGTDSRHLRVGELFVALSGPHFDGHQFVADIAAAGAAGAVVARRVDSPLPQVQVPDTLAALQNYAAAWRREIETPVVAVTGSNGKTTVKQMLAAILASRGPVLATAGNLNNHIGVPLTLLRLRAAHRAAVIEMGANHSGEIDRLAAIARPTIGVVTLAGQAHVAGFGSLEGVARAKGELFQALPCDGVAVINADDRYASLWLSLSSHCSQLTFGLSGPADFTAIAASIRPDTSGCAAFDLVTPAGVMPVQLALPGRHQIANALAAAAAAYAAGVGVSTIAAALSRVRPVTGRLRWRTGPGGLRVLDDTYNANPGSLRVALELLTLIAGESWLVLGDMGELGSEAEDAHRAAGRLAREMGVQRVFALGSLSALSAETFGDGAEHFSDRGSLLCALHAALKVMSESALPGVLVKGSRSMRMERVVERLLDPTPAPLPGEG